MRYLHDESTPVHGLRGDPALREAIRIARDLDATMMPLATSVNTVMAGNEQPTFEKYWEPLGINPASASAVTMPTAAGAGALVPGAVMSFISAGVGSYPPLGFGAASNQGGDWGNSGNPTFPNNWTTALVDLAAVSATTLLAGILLGVGSPGNPAPVVPNTIAGPATIPSLVAMVARLGIVQVLVDNSTTIAHTVNMTGTATHTGQGHDSGGTAYTLGSTLGVALQAVTISAGPLPCWIKLSPSF